MAMTAVRRRFGVADHHRMAEAGIPGARARAELLDADVVGRGQSLAPWALSEVRLDVSAILG